MSPEPSPLASAPENRLEQRSVPSLNDQVRERLREELRRKGWSTRDCAGLLDWSQSRVAKLLAGRVEFSLNELEAFCTLLHLRPTEVVRDRGLEFCREMAPSDLRLFEMLERDPDGKAAILTLLNLRATPRPARVRTKPAKASLAAPKG
jgi:transcriptional regulator with XRE-family HTH domain